MTVTDELKIIKKIKVNQAQHDLDRLAANISAYSSGHLRKYEYLTGEDLGYKPSVVEQAKFEYSPLGKNFNNGLDKDEDKKIKFLIEIKKLQLFSKANKINRLAKNESDYNYDNGRAVFYKF